MNLYNGILKQFSINLLPAGLFESIRYFSHDMKMCHDSWLDSKFVLVILYTEWNYESYDGWEIMMFAKDNTNRIGSR